MRFFLLLLGVTLFLGILGVGIGLISSNSHTPSLIEVGDSSSLQSPSIYFNPHYICNDGIYQWKSEYDDGRYTCEVIK